MIKLSIHDCSPSSEDVDVLQISIDIGELRSEAEELRAQVLTLQADRDALVIQKKKMEVNGLLNSWIPVFSDCLLAMSSSHKDEQCREMPLVGSFD